MPSRQIATAADCDHLIKLLQHKTPPYVVSITDGRQRSVQQNRLQRLWIKEAAEQLGEYTAEQYRAYCKLHFGIPILRNESDEYREVYDRLVRPLSYEKKMELMAVPLDFAVTRLMKVGQKKQYLDDMYQHFSELGVLLTSPESER